MISAVILAAGQSLRLGQPKLLLPIMDRSLIRCVVETALESNVDQVVVVLGANARIIRSEMQRVEATRHNQLLIVENTEYELGQSTSLRAGLRALPDRCTAALIVMGDQPFVTADMLNSLIHRFQVGDVPLVYPTYDGQRGTPVLFSRDLFPELFQVAGDQGGRGVVTKYLEQGAAVAMARPEEALDIDTWQDYTRACQMMDSNNAYSER